MKSPPNIAPALAAFMGASLAFLLGCASLYHATVSLTSAVESAARDYARAYNAGLVPPDVAASVARAHMEYRRTAGVAADALEAYKAGKTVDTKAALESARIAANHFVDLLVGLLTKDLIAE